MEAEEWEKCSEKEQRRDLKPRNHFDTLIGFENENSGYRENKRMPVPPEAQKAQPQALARLTLQSREIQFSQVQFVPGSRSLLKPPKSNAALQTPYYQLHEKIICVVICLLALVWLFDHTSKCSGSIPSSCSRVTPSSTEGNMQYQGTGIKPKPPGCSDSWPSLQPRFVLF